MGRAYFQAGGKPYVVAEVAGRRIGLFAVAGDDFGRLVKSDNLPPGTRLTPALAAARRSVEALRTVEKVDAVICIGHQPREDDEAMARAVPGIDLVLGTHSHHKGALTTIPGTATRYVAPYQYLAYLSRARLVFHGHALAGIDGGLVAMDESRPEDPAVSRRVAELQKALEAKRPDRFAVIGELPAELSDAGLQDGAAPIGTWATEACRRAAGVHAFFSTASSFRGALPPGRVTVEDFYAAIPYPNRVVTAEMTGEQLLAWLDLSLSRRGSDGFSQASGRALRRERRARDRGSDPARCGAARVRRCAPRCRRRVPCRNHGLPGLRCSRIQGPVRRCAQRAEDGPGRPRDPARGPRSPPVTLRLRLMAGVMEVARPWRRAG